MRNPPPSVTSTWPKPNYVNPERRGPALLISQVILLTIATAFLLMRIYARVWITRAHIGVDDILVIISYVRRNSRDRSLLRLISLFYTNWKYQISCTVMTILVIVAVQHYGWETHIWDLDTRNLSIVVMTRKISWIGMVFYICTANFTKMSLLVFYLRILVAKIDKVITKVTLAVVVAYFIAIFGVLFGQCQYVYPPH